MSLSVVIITQNEEKNIERCLKSVLWAQEIIIVDSGSTDKTREICQRYTSKIFSLKWQGYSKQKQSAIDRSSQDWILSLDADEELSKNLQKEIKETIKQTKFNAYKIKRQLIFNGNLLKYSEGRSLKLRLFRKNKAYMDSKLIHESLVTKEKIAYLKAPLYHHSFSSIHDLLNRMNQYSSLSALEKKRKKEKGGVFKGLLHGLWTFFKIYFLQRAALDGKLGFVFSFYLAESSYYRYIKLLFEEK